MTLRHRLHADELMDGPGVAPATYAEVLRDLSLVNAVTLARRPTVGFLSRALADRRSFRLLDVGFGDGDMLRRIARWARLTGRTCELVGIDLNPRSEGVARADTPASLPIEYHTGDYADLIGQGFDVVVSSLVAHHMSRAEIVAFLRFMEAEAAAGWFVNDLRRSAVAHAAYPWLARALGVHPIVRHDGTLSIARSFRADEWPSLLADAGVAGARVRRRFPFRLCVERLR